MVLNKAHVEPEAKPNQRKLGPDKLGLRDLQFTKTNWDLVSSVTVIFFVDRLIISFPSSLCCTQMTLSVENFYVQFNRHSTVNIFISMYEYMNKIDICIKYDLILSYHSPAQSNK